MTARLGFLALSVMTGLIAGTAHAQAAQAQGPAEGFRWIGVQWRDGEAPVVLPVIFANQEECEFNGKKLQVMAREKGEVERQWACKESYLPPSSPSAR